MAMGGFLQQVLHLPSKGLCDSCCCYAVSTRIHVSILLAPCHNSNVLQLLGSFWKNTHVMSFFWCVCVCVCVCVWHSLHPFPLPLSNITGGLLTAHPTHCFG